MVDVNDLQHGPPKATAAALSPDDATQPPHHRHARPASRGTMATTALLPPPLPLPGIGSTGILIPTPRLQMDRDRIVDPRLDTDLLQARLQSIPFTHPNHVEMVDVVAVSGTFYMSKAEIVQSNVIARGQFTSPFVPGLKMAQFDAKGCTLDSVHAVVEAQIPVMIFPLSPQSRSIRSLWSASS